MITYIRKNENDITVYLEGKIVGSIKKVESGFSYFPKNSSKTSLLKGEILPTVLDVQKSIEDVDDNTDLESSMCSFMISR